MIGEMIKKLRLQKGYSISELANLAGISKSYLSYIERNLQNNPSLDVLSKLAGPLNISIEVFLGENGAKLVENPRALGEEWKELIERTIAEGVRSGRLEVIRSTENNEKDQHKINIIILNIDS